MHMLVYYFSIDFHRTGKKPSRFSVPTHESIFFLWEKGGWGQGRGGRVGKAGKKHREECTCRNLNIFHEKRLGALSVTRRNIIVIFHLVLLYNDEQFLPGKIHFDIYMMSN